MEMEFFQKLFGGGCSHRFSWPRVGTDGKHYQVCLKCGAAYQYDWKKMRRTTRMLVIGRPVDDLATGARRLS